jgi:hypothetical protein
MVATWGLVLSAVAIGGSSYAPIVPGLMSIETWRNPGEIRR